MRNLIMVPKFSQVHNTMKEGLRLSVLAFTLTIVGNLFERDRT